MSEITLGILIFVLTLGLYVISLVLFNKSRIQAALIVVILTGFILRVYVASDNYLHPWDERYHALVAKNMTENPLVPVLYKDPILPYDYKEWYSNYYWVHKQPLPLWCMSASLELFGEDEFSIRIPSIILSTLGILITFLIGLYFFNNRVAFIAALLYSMNGLIVELTGGRVATDHYDVFFLFFIQLGVFFSIKYASSSKPVFNALVGLSVGLAILTKWLPALIVLPIWVLLVYDIGRFSIKTILLQLCVIILIIIAVAAPWQIYSANAFPLETAWEQYYNKIHITQVLEERDGGFWFFFNRVRISYGELIYLPIIWLLSITVSNSIRYKNWALIIWFLIPFIFFTIVKTKMQGYILFTSPSLFIITGAFFIYLQEKAVGKIKRLTFIFIMFLLIALPFRYSVERTKLLSPEPLNLHYVDDLKALKLPMEEKAVLFNYNKPIEAMFYTNLIAYKNLPNNNLINELVLKGYRVYIAEGEKVTSEYRNNPNITILKLEQATDVI